MSDAALDQPAFEDVFLCGVQLSLQHYPVSHALEQIFTKHRLWLALLEKQAASWVPDTHACDARAHSPANFRDEVLLGGFHVVDEDEAYPVFLPELQEFHEGLGDLLLALLVTDLREPHVFAESVDDDEAGLCEDSLQVLLQSVVEDRLLVLVEQSCVLDPLQDAVYRELFLVFLEQ